MKVRAERVPIETLREWVSYDSASGHIVWVKGKKAVSVGMRAGYVANTGHRVFKIEQKRYFAHRVAWGIHHGRWPPDGFDVDHINGNRDDNTAANLRLATRSQNIANSKISARNTSGVKGVTWSKRERKWMTQIRVEGKRIGLGYYHHIDDAAKAYREAAVRYFGQFANFG